MAADGVDALVIFGATGDLGAGWEPQVEAPSAMSITMAVTSTLSTVGHSVTPARASAVVTATAGTPPSRMVASLLAECRSSP